MTQSTYANDASRWAAVSGRDPDAEGCFVYCVKTTKIFCRPTCPARLARRSNIEFFNNAVQAEAAGYRACKRCQPTLERFVPNTEKMIRKVTLILDRLPQDASIPSLDALAREAGMTKYHFHRSFKKVTGYTPRQYALAKQRRREAASDPVNDALQLATPDLTGDASPSTGTNETPDDGLDPYGCSTLWTPLELDSLLDFECIDWHSVRFPELDEYLDGYTGTGWAS